VIAKPSTIRAQELRQRRLAAGLSEVRGIWAPQSEHAAIKALAERLQRKRKEKA
jgi:hypothetical protein